ncbi:MAG: GTPase HflX [Thaumarchaeota archaeon]|nr:GTPase HflX [Nitrososphaerota archaeon]MCL5317219.1 GTPase HflX [Nitrososphaerota archaeon]
MSNTANPHSKAVLIAYHDPFAKQEAIGLAEAAGFEVAQTVVQRYLKHGEFGVGSGKAEEIKQIAETSGCKNIIVDEGLTSSQIYNLSKITGKNIIDREKLILDIFASRATTTEAKLQVQLAELGYEMPRARQNVRLSVKGEQQGLSGIGEYAVDVRFRALKKQMVSIKAKLREAEKRRDLYRSQRQKLNMPLVSLVGYTSSGKTTLFNRMTDEDKEVASSLFTTLGTTTRTVSLPDSTKILLSDTVGFISRLPTYMIEAFKSTLEELNYANVVLLVVDASESPYDISIKYSTCLTTLKELKVAASKVITVLNKSDIASKANIDEAKDIVRDSPHTVISAKCGDGTRLLKNLIMQNVKPAPRGYR